MDSKTYLFITAFVVVFAVGFIAGFLFCRIKQFINRPKKLYNNDSGIAMGRYGNAVDLRTKNINNV